MIKEIGVSKRRNVHIYQKMHIKIGSEFGDRKGLECYSLRDDNKQATCTLHKATTISRQMKGRYRSRPTRPPAKVAVRVQEFRREVGDRRTSRRR